MALEPWEIELQKNIEKIVDNNSVKTDEVAIEEKPSTAETVVEKNDPQKTQNNGSLTFLVLFLILSAAILYVYNDKSDGKLKQWFSSTFKYSKEKDSSKSKLDEFESDAPRLQPKLQPKAEPAPSQKIEEKLVPKSDDANKENNGSSDQKTKIDEIAKKLDVTANRVILMGMLLNENFNILEQNIKDNFMYFNADWTLDRMPRYLQLSESDIDYLRKYTKNQ